MGEDSEARRRLDAEADWIEARGGRDWIDRYVAPFYLSWGSYGPRGRAAAIESIPDLRARADELSLEEISTMIVMQWRVQVVGTWFGIARIQPSLSDAVNRGLGRCLGRLTAPGLITAALTYRNAETIDAITEYRDRDLAHQFGAAGIANAALNRLGVGNAIVAPADDDGLDYLLSIASELQQPA